MEDSSNKKYILNICKIAYKLFVENKIIFSKEDIQAFYSDFDKNEEVMANKRLKIIPMICGLANKNQNSLIKFLVNLNPLNESLPWLSSFRNWFSGNRKISHTGIIWILDRLSKSKDRKDYHDLFIECFYESQSSFTDEIKSIVDKRWWSISIDDGKTSYLTSCENYFINHYLKSGRKLRSLRVDKNILSDEEKKLLIQCSTNVRYVIFRRPINFEGWKPKDKIEVLYLWISRYLVTKKDFEENFLPWINLCEELHLELHKDIDFIKEICEWIRCSNIKEFMIKYRENYFCNLDELKNFTTR
ncbi:uncharacterized protein LOC136073952 [Hydra vulgaris]|uniref:Uncharacterized protein LOC136073952 n=1 Tax=Hydra vulgaris TaxID=6087 RepID=A0ABM4B0L4_HYDVU